jgi:uncharacterized protein (TIGR04255 family)
VTSVVKSRLMYFPESDRVIYARNPLMQVACQLRFPPILKIAQQEPFDFQDQIRAWYPLFESGKMPFPPEISQMAQQLNLPFLGEVCHTFKSEDQKWQLSITKDFILLSTSAYERYEQFQGRFREVVEIFESFYQPAFYTRIGLQYQDLIVRSKLGLEDRKWSDLITEHIASELHNPEMADSIQAVTKNLVLCTEEGQVNFNHGLVTVKEEGASQGEIAYLLDSDFYTDQKMERDEHVWNLLSKFNQSAGKLFRWSITDVLHKALEPQPVERRGL